MESARPAAAPSSASRSSASSSAPSSAPSSAGRFADRATESLYQSYNAKQKRAAFACYVSASVLFDVYCLSVYDARSPWTWCLLAANVATLLWCRLAGDRRRYWTVVAHLAWLTADVQVLFHMVANAAEGADLLGWILLYDYLAYVSLPLTLALCVALGATTCVTYMLTMAVLGQQHAYLARQVKKKKKTPAANDPAPPVAVTPAVTTPPYEIYIPPTPSAVHGVRTDTLG